MTSEFRFGFYFGYAVGTLALVACLILTGCGAPEDYGTTPPEDGETIEAGTAGAPALPTCAIELPDVCGLSNAVQVVCDRDLSDLSQPCANQHGSRDCNADVLSLKCTHMWDAKTGGVLGTVWCCS